MYVPTGFTPEEEVALVKGQAATREQLERIISWQKAEEERRKWTLIIGGVGLLFAALKLGIFVVRDPMRDRSRTLGITSRN
jgi:hypothetical protein